MKLNINDICYNHDVSLCVNPCNGCDDFKSKASEVKVTKRIIIKQKNYEIGDKVLIKKSWKKLKEAPDPEMDKFLDTIVTINEIYDNEAADRPNTYRMKEDKGYWVWFDYYIKGKVIE